jgi:hypothetical protein
LTEPRNFDELYNGQRSFILAGQTFHWRPIHWREWGEMIDARAAEEIKEQEERQGKIDALVAEGKPALIAAEIVDDEKTLVSSFEDVVTRCAAYLEEDEVVTFAEVMHDKKNRISAAMLSELQVWLQEVQTPDRPTETPSDSSSGPGKQGATSPAA